MNEIISSSQNDKIKYLNKLYRSRTRRKEGVFVLEGKRLIEAASAGGADFERVFLSPAFFKADKNKDLIDKLQNRVSLDLVSEELLKETAATVNPQGIIAIVKEPNYSSEKFFKTADKILLLDRIQDPGNMGTMIRTAAAAGFEAVIALKGSVDIYNQKVIRASMGGIFAIPIWQKVSKNEFKKDLKDRAADFELLAADIKAEKYHFEHQYQQKLILMIGNEANGLAEDLLNIADMKVKIPLKGEMESLNAAIAAAVISFEILAQQLK
ncbi:TrmH family RNA methyltransferase [Halanaerobium hydrogeniformans]|uniref:tRNA/rRNA methyltransferase (SpoU) n=1 Tax=Halanaerobium hydrogeniformans TaxID=656519 RepID=E4RLI3_HALHG|nr:RNA methyltransferase [Halanaerobium hydrogeniformans]ADQ14897.1 tRNA/rRNA methyltransferase (SpoU) [Halanaerobium hydrogeniformans]